MSAVDARREDHGDRLRACAGRGRPRGRSRADGDPAAAQNLTGRFAATGTAFLDGPAEQWAEDLAGLTVEYGVSAFVLAADDPATIERFAAEVAPATRELVAAERAR
ncbi:hypothetical protein [Micromonospora echinospora]|uniref:hypothetical protein n=1 Tax=Micromonospora echinospora TaxID=1877 RepID=UPI003A88BBFF